VLKREFTNTVLSTARQNFNNIVPTTYEASKIYLDEEMMKPKGQRDLQREMCMIVVMRIPSNQEVVLKLDAPKVLVPLTQGERQIFDVVGNFRYTYFNRHVRFAPQAACFFTLQ
jgi:hypothetical protein